MANYVELIVGARLRPDIPREILAVLRFMVGMRNRFENRHLPRHKLFKTKKWAWLFKSGSYAFGLHQAHARLTLDPITNAYELDVRSSIPNQEDIVAKFADWIRPYVANGSGTKEVYAIALGDKDSTPKMYRLKN